MHSFRETLLVLITTPIYLIVIGIEVLVSNLHHNARYTLKGSVENLYLMLLNSGIDLVLRGLALIALTYTYSFHFTQINNPVVYWVVLLIAEDFMFYLLHTAEHHVRVLWAVHVTHHSSEEFNFTVGFRSSVLQPFYRFLFFLPLTFLGFKGIDILFMFSATQIYGILIHTQYVGKLGFLEHILATPSNHRVHHGTNAPYLDRNMGMVFIIWDKIFGTYSHEEEEVRYGITQNLTSHHPMNVIFHEWRSIWQDVNSVSSWRLKLMYIFGPPGWSHDNSKKTSRQLRAEYSKSKA